MSRDSSFNHLHRTHSKYADFADSFLQPSITAPDLQISPEHQPANPEDEDDVVPDQHAAFGIQRATQARREPEWRDLGLAELLAREGQAHGHGTEGGSSGGGGGGGGSSGTANANVNGFVAAGRISEVTRDMIRASLGRREDVRGRNGVVGTGNDGAAGR